LSEEGKFMYIPFYELDAAAEVKRRGIEEGIEKGIEKGKIEVARNMLAEGIAADIVVKSTGLPADQVRKLMN
jgi:predicted transposase/invertase (TIGR01784 family)